MNPSWYAKRAAVLLVLTFLYPPLLDRHSLEASISASRTWLSPASQEETVDYISLPDQVIIQSHFGIGFNICVDKKWLVRSGAGGRKKSDLRKTGHFSAITRHY